MDKLAGVRAKLDRASTQLEALDDEIQRFRKCEAYSISGEFDAESSNYIFRLHIHEWPPIEWGVLSGEIIHNMRSALDNIIYQLVLRAKGKPGKWNVYPFCTKLPKRGFSKAMIGTSKHRGPLAGVGHEAITIIERTQPYHGGMAEQLLALDALWNIDKHKFLMPLFFTLDDPETLGPVFRANEDTNIVGQIEYADTGWHEDGAKLVVVPLEVVGPNPKVDMDGEFPLDITFGRGGAAIDILKTMIFFIRVDVLPPIEELFAS
ncbi:MAG TPA: hypothetical protein VG053_00990 [Solirubrobacteraceae bacterium]|jgi:hypothetical protein|nr:hypothetical protein [Solirubrobacteraceae bacterium]